MNRPEDDRAAPVGSPACIDGFISVGAVTKSRQVASFSNSGPTLELLAPGVDIESAVPQDPEGPDYESYDGTSMAAPHVAGAIALLKQAAPSASVGQLLLALKSSGRSVVDRRNGVSAPLIDLAGAMRRFVRIGGSTPPDGVERGPEPPGNDATRPPESPGKTPEPPADEGEPPKGEKEEPWRAVTE